MSGRSGLFLVLAVVAAFFGFSGVVVGAVAGIVKWLSVFLFVLFLSSLVIGDNGGMVRRDYPPPRSKWRV